MLFVANHISWVDILLMKACCRTHFVAKSEVRQWPLIGWMAARTGTLFLKRNCPRALSRAVKAAGDMLRHGECIAHFPEGTTTDGCVVHSFHSGFFQSAIDADALIWPVGISYRRADGSRDVDIAFVGSQSLVCSILQVLTQPATEARLSFGRPVRSSECDRRALAIRCRQAIEQSLTTPLACPILSKTVPLHPLNESLLPLSAT